MGFSSQAYWSGCHFLLQRIFPTQESNPGLLHCREIRYQLSYKGNPDSKVVGEGNGTPLQYLCLENPVDGGAWWAAVHGVGRVGYDWATSLWLFTFMHWRRNWQPTPVFLPGEFQGWEAWLAAVYGVVQSRTRLKLHSSSSRHKTMSMIMLSVNEQNNLIKKNKDCHRSWTKNDPTICCL